MVLAVSQKVVSVAGGMLRTGQRNKPNNTCTWLMARTVQIVVGWMVGIISIAERDRAKMNRLKARVSNPIYT
jgi:hypothetical protein